jgi:hypothetical protein
MINRGSAWAVGGAFRRCRLLALALAVVGGGLFVSASPSGAVGGEVGYRDFSYQTSSPNTTPSAPTAKEVQSKLWFNDGSWWGVLFTVSAKAYQIYRFDWAAQSWISTGVTVDTRVTTRNDVLWDGTHLYVASAGTSETTSNQSAKIRRFAYDAATKKYTVESGYPVTISSNGMQAVVIAKDTTGTVWATWTQQSKVWVTHTTTDEKTWVAPYVLPAANSTDLLSQDESGVIAYNGKIGVMWGDQNPSAWGYYFAVHNDGDPDGVWQSMAAHQVADESDNHLNMKALDADPAGQVFAAVKTSLNHPNDPLYHLMVLQNDNTWRTYPLARVADDWTRATVLIDKESRRIYAFGASPCCNGGAVYYKVSSLDNISFPVGQGTPLMQTSTDLHINNPTSTKQALTSATGLLAIASDDNTHRYVHNSFGLGSGDVAPPDTTIDTGPPATSFTSSVTFGFSASEAGAAFSCSLDGAAFSACASPTSYPGIADGSHTFQVRATDFAANTDPTPASRTWTIDTSNPTLTLSPDADAEVNSGTPDTNLGTATTIAVDNSPATQEAYLRFPVTGSTGTILSAKLRVFATDGTIDGPAVYSAGSTWSEAGITWNNRPARTGAALDDKAGVTGGTWVEYDVRSVVTGNGTYTFNLGPTSADAMRLNSRQAASNKPQLALIVQSDTAAPETAVDSGPSGTVGSGSASFGFSSSEAGSTFQCSLDGAAFEACASPRAYGGLAEGGHTFGVYATDAAGNADATPAERAWTVDKVAPAAPVIVSPVDGSVNSTGTVTVSGAAEPVSTVAVFDGAAQQGTAAVDAGGSWSLTLTGVGDGSHGYTARATDAAGNTSAASAGVTVTVDGTPPDTSIDSGPSGTVASGSASFAFSSDKPGSTFHCSLAGAGFTACTSPQAYSSLAEGGHAFAVYATDPLGHADPTPATRTWTIDATAPTVASVTPPDGAAGVPVTATAAAVFSEDMAPASVTPTTFTLSAQGSGSPVSATVGYDAAARTATLTPQQILAPAETYVATVTGGPAGARDLAGNPLGGNVSWTFTTDQPDSTAPETVIVSGPSGLVSSGSAQFGFSSSEAGSTFHCSLDAAAYAPCTSPQAYSGLADGSHTFGVYATDPVGNADPTPAERIWTVDTAAPAAPVILSPADGNVNGTGTVTVTGTAEPLSTVAVSDGASQQGTATVNPDRSWSLTLTGVTDGSHTYTARATDAAGNTSPASAGVTVTVDGTPPNTTIDSGPSGTVASGSASFAFSSDKPGSTFHCSLDGGAFQACTSPRAYSGLAEGGHAFAVYATDSLGHVDPTPAGRTWTIDLTIFSDGFESGSFRSPPWVVKTGADGTATVQPGIGKNGTYGARLAETATTGSLAYARTTFAARTDLTVAGDVNVLAEGASGGNVPLLRLFDASGTRLVSLYRQNVAQDKLYVQHGGTSVLTSGRLALNTWAHVEIHVITAGTGTSTVEVRVNGAAIYQTTTASLGTAGIPAIQIGNETAKQAFTLVADNITIIVAG